MTLHAASAAEQRELYEVVRTELIDNAHQFGVASLSDGLRTPLMNIELFGLAAVVSEGGNVDSYEVRLTNKVDVSGGDIANLHVEFLDTTTSKVTEAVVHRGGSRIFRNENANLMTKQEVTFIRLLLSTTIWDEQNSQHSAVIANPQSSQV